MKTLINVFFYKYGTVDYLKYETNVLFEIDPTEEDKFLEPDFSYLPRKRIRVNPDTFDVYVKAVCQFNQFYAKAAIKIE